MSNRYHVAVGFPGPWLSFAAAKALWTATLGRHTVTVIQSPLGAWDAFNAVWVDSLNMAAKGEVSHFAMLHSDIDPQPGWLDILIEELDRLDADCVSAVVPLKDARGLTSTAIGDPADPWQPWRRFTLREIAAFPETFDNAAAGYPDKPLLVNTGCLVCDLRKPVYQTVLEGGEVPIAFNFPTCVGRGPGGKFESFRESEDWHFSRRLAEFGGKAWATRTVQLNHLGEYPFPNHGELWGQLKHGDEETAHKWDAANSRIDPHGCWLGPAAERYHRRDGPLEQALCAFLGGPDAARHKAENTVADFGCGMGSFVRALCAAGNDAWGFDGNPATLELTEGLGAVLDLALPQDLDRQWDWVLCLEVIEHIPAEFEAVVLDNLARHARKGIIASWATPGQAGHGHYNERPAEYAVARFAERGFRVNRAASEALRAAATLPWFRENLLVLERVD